MQMYGKHFIICKSGRKLLYIPTWISVSCRVSSHNLPSSFTSVRFPQILCIVSACLNSFTVKISRLLLIEFALSWEIRRSISRDWLIVQTAIEARPRGRSVLINFFLRLHRDCHFRLQSEQSGRSWELARNYYSRRSNSRFIFSECIATLWYEVKIQIYVT